MKEHLVLKGKKTVFFAHQVTKTLGHFGSFSPPTFLKTMMQLNTLNWPQFEVTETGGSVFLKRANEGEISSALNACSRHSGRFRASSVTVRSIPILYYSKSTHTTRWKHSTTSKKSCSQTFTSGSLEIFKAVLRLYILLDCWRAHYIVLQWAPSSPVKLI